MFEASLTESMPPPAPIIVWSSSIKTITSLSCVTSFTIAVKRSSNSPRNFVPATTIAIFKAMIRLPRKPTGTFPAATRVAKPSIIADLPTPGSPTRTGLFFVRRLKIWIRRSTSRSLPIIGSSFPSRAAFVKSVETVSKVGVVVVSDTFPDRFLFEAGVTALRRSGTRKYAFCSNFLRRLTILMFCSRKSCPAKLASFANSIYKRCSVPIRFLSLF